VARLTSVIRSRLFTFVFGAMVALSTVAGVAVAQDDNTVSACALNSTGALRLVDDAADCRPAETPVAWSVTGPEGPAGPPGELDVYEQRATVYVGDPRPSGTSLSCQSGETLIAGGYQAYPYPPPEEFTTELWSEVPASPVIGSFPVYSPTADASSWQLVYRTPGDSTQAWQITIYLHCAR
jgi:hypothetical protein